MKLVSYSFALLFYLGIIFSSYAQTNKTITLQEDYQNHFAHFRETIHLHLNKTTYFVGEEIWWTAYAYNKKTSSPSLETANLYCGLYNETGTQIKKELFLLKDGVGHGSFKVDSTLSSGTYFIKAGTTWMKNFDEDKEFIRKISIINQFIDESQTTRTEYDLQILPEGGHILKDSENNIGVKLTNQYGKGIRTTSGIILNNSQQKVAEVVTSTYGIGKFNLPKNVDFPLTLKISMPDGTSIEKELPKAKEKGIVMNVNNILEDRLIISLKTNPTTLENIKEKHFHLAIHRDGLMSLKTFKLEKLGKTIKIDKKKLLSGTNIITLFDEELNPISERLIFNYLNIKLGKLTIDSPKRKNKDSVSMKIHTFSKNNSPFSLSVSVLPSGTIARKTNANIISNFLLQPYIKSQIENPSRFFSEVDRKKEYELDLVLLTQGWSSYDWGNIFTHHQEKKYPLESGITVHGTINSKLKKDDELAVYTGELRTMNFLKLEDSTNFKINNLHMYNGDTLKFALRNRKGKLRKSEISLDFKKRIDVRDSVSQFLRRLHSLSFFKPFSKESLHETQNPLLIKDKTIQLDEVVLIEDKIEKKLKRKSPLVSSLFNGFKITDEDVKKTPLLSDFIRRQGFLVNEDLKNGILIISNPRRFAGPVAIYENDQLLHDSFQLSNVPLHQIDEIYLTKLGTLDRPDYGGGAIHIYRKTEGYHTITSSFAEKLVENSFVKPKKFYLPKYTAHTDESFLNYGVLHWEPNIVTDEQGEAVLTMSSTSLPTIKVFIEGMGEDGSLLSHTQEISLD